MAHTNVSFSSSQDIIVVREEKVTDIASVDVTQWIEETDANGNYVCHCRIANPQVGLSYLCASDTAFLASTLDSSDTADSKIAAIVKRAIETGDYK
jgi:hypothetical protein